MGKKFERENGMIDGILDKIMQIKKKKKILHENASGWVIQEKK